jgi:hypothetical protein
LFNKGIRFNYFDRKKGKNRTKRLKKVKRLKIKFRVCQNKINSIIINILPLYQVVEKLISEDAENNQVISDNENVENGNSDEDISQIKYDVYHNKKLLKSIKKQ